MFSKFLPRKTNFFDYFEAHGALIVQGAEELVLLVSTGRFEVFDHAHRIRNIEHEADKVTHHCIEALHKTFITPFERNDIHQLISRMDDIMDFIHDTAERIVIYKLQVMKSGVQELADVLLRATKEIKHAVHELRAFKSDAIRQRCITIKRLEDESDVIHRRVIGELFEDEQNVCGIIKWKEIYENLENATDRCEDVANIMENVILEYS